jgi:PAS domain S-box-containing protein
VRFDIENKILFPFIILLILSIITLGIVSYWNGYQLLLENEVKNLSRNLDEMVFYIENIQEDIDKGLLTEEEGKEIVLDFYRRAEKNNLFIFDKERVLLSSFDEGQEWFEIMKSENLEEGQKRISTGNYLLTYKTYDKWGWILGYRLNKGIFSFEVLENQKYMVLVAIISLLFSMQATIFIAHNISKPIKMLADICDKIAQGNFQEKIDIKRKDEIGILANAFNNMVYRLQINTTKLLNITRLNEDILKNISTGIITTDQHGEILSVNKAAKDFLSMEDAKDINNDIKQKLLYQLNETLRTNKNINNVYVFDNIIEGNKIYLDATTSLLKTDDAPASGAICNFNDISERKKIENNMVTLDRLTSIGKLAAGIAHEIRNPLAGMKTSIQVLKNRLCKDQNGSNTKLFNGVLYEINRINHLITGILNFAKPRIPKYEKVDLIEVLNRVLDLLNKTPEKKNIKINKINNSSNSLVYVDKDQIEQIFLNIMQNSFAAMNNVDGVLNISIDNYQEESGTFVNIEFHDNGCGIEPENLDKIYDPFFTTRHQGTGLGLSVVYELIKGNNGVIEVLSSVDIGTKFIIKFPIYGGNKDE